MKRYVLDVTREADMVENPHGAWVRYEDAIEGARDFWLQRIMQALAAGTVDDPAQMPMGSGPYWNREALVTLLNRAIADRTALAHNGGGEYYPDTDPVVIAARRSLEAL